MNSHFDEKIGIFLKTAREKKASDILLCEGEVPSFKIQGQWTRSKSETISKSFLVQFLQSICDSNSWSYFQNSKELDLSLETRDYGRFRINLFHFEGKIGSVFRSIPNKIPSRQELGLPEIIDQWAQLQSGLILVTGPTGSGKSTTLAYLIDQMNRTRYGHIITIEDPIEFIHQSRSCIVHQREVGRDTKSFSEAAKRALRQTPTVVMIGELRDTETAQAALTTAETGHLVLATLHTRDSVSTIQRFLNIFSHENKNKIQDQFASQIQGILSQQLVLNSQGNGLILVPEILVPNQAVRNLIREDKTHQIYSFIQTQANTGSKTLNQTLIDLVQKGIIHESEALQTTSRPEELTATLMKPPRAPIRSGNSR